MAASKDDFLSQPIDLPDFRTVFDSEVYSIDFITPFYSEGVKLNDPDNLQSGFSVKLNDPNVLRRGFLVLGRYQKPALPEVTVYLQQIVQQNLASTSKGLVDAQLSPLIAELSDQDLIVLLEGNTEKVASLLPDKDMLLKGDGMEYLDVEYFVLPAPLCREHDRKMNNPEWYHHAPADKNLQENGLQRFFLITMNYGSLLRPHTVERTIQNSPQQHVGDKEGAKYVLNNICHIFSSPPHFARIKDITPRKVKLAALEALLGLQKDDAVKAEYQSYLERTSGLKINLN